MNQATDNSQTGRLIVSVRTADGSIPVANAKVSVFYYGEDNSDLIAVLVSDNSGNTPALTVETPDRELSESPGNAKGYTSLVIQVDKDNFITNQYVGTAVFPGVTTLQQVNLVPDPEFSDGNEPIEFFESEAADL